MKAFQTLKTEDIGDTEHSKQGATLETLIIGKRTTYPTTTCSKESNLKALSWSIENKKTLFTFPDWVFTTSVHHPQWNKKEKAKKIHVLPSKQLTSLPHPISTDLFTSFLSLSPCLNSLLYTSTSFAVKLNRKGKENTRSSFKTAHQPSSSQISHPISTDFFWTEKY